MAEGQAAGSATTGATTGATTPQVALVTGANGGIGAATCRRLAAAGWQLALLGRREDALAELAAELGAGTAPERQPLVLVADATNSEQVNAAVARVIERFGRVDGVAHLVGSLLLKPGHLTTDADWDAVIASNLSSAFYVVRAALRPMSRQGSGAIVLASSVAARAGLANHEGIAAAKAGIVGLTLATAATYAAKGIRVNAVAPGLVRTPLTRRLTESEGALKASLALHPLGRVGEADEVAQAVVWLLSDVGSWITGQVISLDGGMSSLRVPPRA